MKIRNGCGFLIYSAGQGLIHPSHLQQITTEINSFEILLFLPKMLNKLKLSTNWGFLIIPGICLCVIFEISFSISGQELLNHTYYIKVLFFQ